MTKISLPVIHAKPYILKDTYSQRTSHTLCRLTNTQDQHADVKCANLHQRHRQIRRTLQKTVVAYFKALSQKFSAILRNAVKSHRRRSVTRSKFEYQARMLTDMNVTVMQTS